MTICQTQSLGQGQLIMLTHWFMSCYSPSIKCYSPSIKKEKKKNCFPSVCVSHCVVRVAAATEASRVVCLLAKIAAMMHTAQMGTSATVVTVDVDEMVSQLRWQKGGRREDGVGVGVEGDNEDVGEDGGGDEEPSKLME